LNHKGFAGKSRVLIAPRTHRPDCQLLTAHQARNMIFTPSTPVRLLLAGSAMAIVLAGCSTYDSTSRKIANAITPYRIDIVQGNFVSREAAAQLREGMTRDQVRFILGTPLLNDIFHANQWDYVFAFRRGSSLVVQQRRYTVQFDGDRLVKFGGDDLPSEYELIAEIDGIRKPGEKKAAAPAPEGAAQIVAPPGTPVPTGPDQSQTPAAALTPAPTQAVAPTQALAPATAPATAPTSAPDATQAASSAAAPATDGLSRGLTPPGGLQNRPLTSPTNN
jgi:outer membrane protein assembly factor BamE